MGPDGIPGETFDVIARGTPVGIQVQSLKDLLMESGGVPGRIPEYNPDGILRRTS